MNLVPYVRLFSLTLTLSFIFRRSIVLYLVSGSRFFKEIAPEMADFDSPFDTLAILAEVVSSDDEMLSLGKPKYFC
jgi:hypothetical protein